jgi:hypothetical protein
MSNRRNQVDALLAYLKRHPEGIDRGTADEELGICSLARRVCDLIDLGYRIGKRRKKVPTRYTRSTYLVVYYLEDPPKATEAPATMSEGRSPDEGDSPVPAPPPSPRGFKPQTEERGGQGLMFPA